MKLVTKKLEKLFSKYPLRSQEHEEDPLLIAKFFNPYGAGTWYVMEAQAEGDDYYFFGYVELQYGELGPFRLSELKNVKLPFGGQIERDMYFEPVRLSEVKAKSGV